MIVSLIALMVFFFCVLLALWLTLSVLRRHFYVVGGVIGCACQISLTFLKAPPQVPYLALCQATKPNLLSVWSPQLAKFLTAMAVGLLALRR